MFVLTLSRYFISVILSSLVNIPPRQGEAPSCNICMCSQGADGLLVSRLQVDPEMLIPGHVWTMQKTISEAQPGPAVHFSFLSMCLQQWGSQPSELQGLQATPTFRATNTLSLTDIGLARYLQSYSTTFIRCNLWGEQRGHDVIDIRSFCKKTGRIYREINKYIGPGIGNFVCV